MISKPEIQDPQALVVILNQQYVVFLIFRRMGLLWVFGTSSPIHTQPTPR